jgi:hypothetical protein
MAEPTRTTVPGPSSAKPGAAGPPSQVSARPDGARAGYSTVVEDGFSGWGWFAGGLMMLVGLFQIMAGIVALAGPGYYTAPTRDLVVDAGYTTWGWVHLILGILALAAGGGLVFGSTVARVAGIGLAVISAVVNLAFLPAAPAASTLIIALDVFLIYAITVHGGEAKGSFDSGGRA